MIKNHFLQQRNSGDELEKIQDPCPLCGADLYVIIDNTSLFITELTDGTMEYCADDSAHLFKTGRIPGRALIDRSGKVLKRF